MTRINSIQPIQLNNRIAFKQNDNTNNYPSALIRPLQGPTAGTRFEQKVFEQQAMDDYESTVKSDAVRNNPLSAAYNKFVKAYKILFPANDYDNINQHIVYMGA